MVQSDEDERYENVAKSTVSGLMVPGGITGHTGEQVCSGGRY